MQATHGDPRSLGVVYTPPEVTEPMARVALEPLLRGRGLEEICALRICDPAIGEGAFLLAAVLVIAEHLVASGLPADVARAGAVRCVHGVDVDPRAVAAARAALGAGAEQLQVGDALALDWPGAFPEVFARGGFDAVIGNPPYVRQEHLAAHKPLLRRFASYDGAADLYVYFVELAHRLARPGGRFCLITPNKWLTAGYGRALRGHLAAQHSVEGVIDLARTALFGDADAFPCIVWGTAGAPCDTPIEAARLAPGAGVELRGVGSPHPRERWRADPWHIDAPGDRALLEQLELRWPPLGDIVPGRPARGVVTGCNRAFVLDRVTRDRLLAAEPAAAAVIRPFVKGRDLRRWLPAEPERWILLVDRGTQLAELPGVLDHLTGFRAALEPRPGDWQGPWRGRKPGPYRWYELQDPVGPLVKACAPRLLYQDIQTGPVCALDRGGDLVPDTTVWMLPSADLYLLAVLSSPLYAWYARRRFPPALNGSVRPKLEYLRNFPIAAPGPDQRAAIEGLVTARLELEPSRRAADPCATAAARELDDALASSVLDAYALSIAERALIARG
ncbi:MAG TPA: Eco57I restriction-modification methylase domain-containing protein [Kofleriaceae bacterium]